MKQTAVEWLQDEYRTSGMLTDNDFKQAKEMEKEQIIDAFKSGNHTEMRGGNFIDAISKQYYIENYGGEQ